MAAGFPVAALQWNAKSCLALQLDLKFGWLLVFQSLLRIGTLFRIMRHSFSSQTSLRGLLAAGFPVSAPQWNVQEHIVCSPTCMKFGWLLVFQSLLAVEQFFDSRTFRWLSNLYQVGWLLVFQSLHMQCDSSSLNKRRPYSAAYEGNT